MEKEQQRDEVKKQLKCKDKDHRRKKHNKNMTNFWSYSPFYMMTSHVNSDPAYFVIAGT